MRLRDRLTKGVLSGYSDSMIHKVYRVLFCGLLRSAVRLDPSFQSLEQEHLQNQFKI